MFVISLVLTVTGLVFRRPLLQAVFGKIEARVMEEALIYFLITVISYPFLALFNAGAAFFRAGGNSGFPMRVSVISNVLNIGGNALLIFGFDMGVAGAALATLISRIFCATAVILFLRKPGQAIVVREYLSIRPDLPLIMKILADRKSTRLNSSHA